MTCCYAHPPRAKNGPVGPCQFHEGEVVAVYEGKYYCRWHLPLAVKATWSEAQNHNFAEALNAHLNDLNGRHAPLDLCGVQFPAAVDFSDQSLVDADFSFAAFADEAQFSSARFAATAKFESTRFNGRAMFNGALFNDKAVFTKATFSGEAQFGSAYFRKRTFFDETVFEGPANFTGVRFDGPAHFTGANWLAENACFISARFDSAALFQQTRFVDALFQMALFIESASFQGATFAGDAQFASVAFHGGARFESVAFNGDTYFAAGNSNESQRIGDSSWKGAVFCGDVSFDNLKFTAAGDFRVKRFARAPRFHGCIFHEAMVFPNEAAFEDRSSEGAAQAYRTLRLGMEKLSARYEAGMFYALEQASLRSTPGRMKRHEWCLSWLYEKWSDYGRSALRPAIVLLCFWLVAGVGYAILNASYLDWRAPIDAAQVNAGLAMSAQQIVQPFWIWRDLRDPSAAGPAAGVRWLATFQSIVCLSLLALVLLAVRWRFKRE